MSLKQCISYFSHHFLLSLILPLIEVHKLEYYFRISGYSVQQLSITVSHFYRNIQDWNMMGWTVLLLLMLMCCNEGDVTTLPLLPVNISVQTNISDYLLEKYRTNFSPPCWWILERMKIILHIKGCLSEHVQFCFLYLFVSV